MCDWLDEQEETATFGTRNPALMNGTKVRITRPIEDWYNVRVGMEGIIRDWDAYDNTYKITLPEIDDWFWFDEDEFSAITSKFSVGDRVEAFKRSSVPHPEGKGTITLVRDTMYNVKFDEVEGFWTRALTNDPAKLGTWIVWEKDLEALVEENTALFGEGTRINVTDKNTVDAPLGLGTVIKYHESYGMPGYLFTSDNTALADTPKRTELNGGRAWFVDLEGAELAELPKEEEGQAEDPFAPGSRVTVLANDYGAPEGTGKVFEGEPPAIIKAARAMAEAFFDYEPTVLVVSDSNPDRPIPYVVHPNDLVLLNEEPTYQLWGLDVETEDGGWEQLWSRGDQTKLSLKDAYAQLLKELAEDSPDHPIFGLAFAYQIRRNSDGAVVYETRPLTRG